MASSASHDAPASWRRFGGGLVTVLGAIALVAGLVLLTITEPVAVDGSTGSGRAWAVSLLLGGALWLAAGLMLRRMPRRPAAAQPQRALLWLAAGSVALGLLGVLSGQEPLPTLGFGAYAVVLLLTYWYQRRAWRRAQEGDSHRQA